VVRAGGAAGGAGPGRRPLDEARRATWEAANEQLASQGIRVLAVASRRLPDHGVLDHDGQVADPERWTDELVLEGLVGLVDPPRPEARDAIARCRAAGIQVKMITGDHAATAGAIAQQLGIRGEVRRGADLDAIDDEQLAAEVEQVGVFARVSPEHKVRVVQALRARGHVVAMTGDGVNDAAALRHADIGVAMGITGTEVTKEAADLVLADDQLPTIVGAVERGRAIYDNIVTFVRFQLTTNLGAIGTLLAASLLAMPAPLSAIQVLFVNIIADGPPAMTLGVDPPRPGTMDRAPREPGAPILDARRFWRLVPAALTMVVGTLGLLVLADDRWGEEIALTMAFTTFVLFQLANVFNARTERGTIFTRASLSNGKLWGVVGAVAALQVAIVQWAPLGNVFDTTPLGLGQWAACLAVAVTVVLVEEARKALLRHT
jgi:Ca2+-transporting ATPase